MESVELIEVHRAKVKGWCDELVYVDLARLSIVSLTGPELTAERLRAMADADAERHPALAREYRELADQLDDEAVAA